MVNGKFYYVVLVALMLFFAIYTSLKFPYTYMTLEGDDFWVLTRDYWQQKLATPPALTNWLSEYLLQFYRSPYVAAGIEALVLGAIGLLAHRTLSIFPIKKSPFKRDLEGLGGLVGSLLAYAYPERIAMQMDRTGRYRLASGDEVRLDRNDPLSSYSWLAIGPLQTSSRGGLGKVFLAAAVEPSDLEELAAERDNVAWDNNKECLLMQHEWRIGQLLLRSKPIHDAPRELQEQVLCDAVKKTDSACCRGMTM